MSPNLLTGHQALKTEHKLLTDDDALAEEDGCLDDEHFNIDLYMSKTHKYHQQHYKRSSVDLELMRNIVPLTTPKFKKSATFAETKIEPVKKDGSRFSLFGRLSSIFNGSNQDGDKDRELDEH